MSDASASTPTPSPSSGAPMAPVADFLGMLRAHALWGLVAAAAVFFLVMRSAVRKPDVFQSDGYIQLNVPEPRSQQDLLAAALALDGGTQTQAELMMLRSRDVARAAASQPAGRVRAFLEPLREPSWGRWWSALRGGAVAEVHVAAAARKAPAASLAGTVRLERLADGAWQAVPLSGLPTAQPLAFRFAEPWTDVDGSGRWDAAELYEDANGNGVYDPPESYDDTNGDGKWNAAEKLDDLDEDGRHDVDEPFVDENDNGVYDPGESYEDIDRDGHRDVAESFDDADGDGIWRAQPEAFMDTDRDDVCFAGETFTDRDGNERWTPAEPFEDLDGNGEHEAGEPLVWAGIPLDLFRIAGDPDGHVFQLSVLSTDDAVERIVGTIDTSEAGTYSDVALVRAVSSDPYQAREIVQAVMNAYVERKYETRLEQTNRLLAWLRAETDTATRRLREAYRRRDQYVRRKGAVLLQERAAAAFEEQGALTRERLQIKFELDGVKSQLESLAAQRTAMELLRLVPADEVDALTSALIDERTRLQMELGRLARHGHGTGSLEYDDARVRFEQTEQLLGQAAANLVKERRAVLDQQRERLESRLAEVKARDIGHEGLIRDLPQLEQGLTEVNRPVEQYERLVQELARWRSEAEIARASTVVPVAVLEQAVLLPAPIAPNRMLDLALAVVAALGAGMGACWLREHLDHRVRNARQVERGVGKPLAGAVPAFRTVRRSERARRSRPLVPLEQETGLLAETYRKLRASIRHEHRDDPIRTMAITSPTQGEGKSLTTMNLAITMAQAGERVLVIDGDLRRPAVHRLAHIKRSPGLVDVLAGELPWQQAVVSGPTSGLDVLPAGDADARGSRLLESPAMTALLAAARATYDAILIDVPPVLAVSDALAFFHHLDGVFLLVRAGRYGTDVPREAAELIERAGGRLCGVILNAFDARLAARRGGAYYGYRYGARYAYR